MKRFYFKILVFTSYGSILIREFFTYFILNYVNKKERRQISTQIK